MALHEVWTPSCDVCGAKVGCYEPAVFTLGDRAIASSRAAQLGLASQPGCRVTHASCFAGVVTETGRRVGHPGERCEIDDGRAPTSRSGAGLASTGG